MKSQRIPLISMFTALCTLCFIGISTAQPTVGLDPTVTGKFIGNDKPANIKFVRVQEDEPFDDKPAIKVTLSEKDASKSKGYVSPGALGCVLELRMHLDGQIFGCQVEHTALKKPSFSSGGEFKMVEFKIADGIVTGRVSCGEEREFFGDRYQADLTFSAPMPKGKSNAAAPSAPLSAAQQAFVDSYKKALETKDTKALAAFLHTEGASADTVEFFTMMQSAGAGEKIDSITLIQPPDEDMKKYNEPKEMPDGQLCKMPFAPTHQLVIVTKDGSGGTSTSRLPVGEHKGKLLIPLPVPVKPASPGAAKAKPAEAPAAEAKPETTAVIAARTLPLPSDASDVQYKQVVNMINFSCARPVAAVAKEFAANLKEQGWKEGKGSLMGAKNAILMREQGKAKLTIMIQPAAQGSEVKVFTDGLDWSAAADAAPAAAAKPASVPSADELEEKANRAVQDALKNLPKGLRP